MNKYLVSAIVTTYNRELSILKRAIESILNQNYKNLEIIIVNDAPDNNKLCEQIQTYIDSINDNRITYIKHDKNYGACRARNTGIQNAKGDFIAFLDDDDEWLPQKIYEQLSLFTDESIGMVYCYYYNIGCNEKKEKIEPSSKSGSLFNELLCENCVGGTSMPLIRKKVFDFVGLFDENLLSSQDYDMWLRISEKYQIVCCAQYLVNRHMQFESIGSNFYKQKQGFYYFIEKHNRFYKANSYAYNLKLTKTVNNWISRGQFKEAFVLLKRAVQIKLITKHNIIEPVKGVYHFLFKK